MRVAISEPNSFINLQGGWPTPRLHPVNDLEAASASLFSTQDTAEELLGYGAGLGRAPFRELIGRWLNDFYRPAAGSIPGVRIGETNGASNGLATILQKFTDPIYTRAAWMVEPTYFLACPIFRDAGLVGRIRGAPEGEDGVDLGFLAKALKYVDDSWPDKTSPPGKSANLGYPKVYRHVVYLIPTFSNPSGKTMTLESRRRLVQLDRKHDALLISDDVYDVLRWPANEGSSYASLPKPPPRLVDVDRESEGTSTFGNAVSNGSFSKIIAPGIRLGWIESAPAFTTTIRSVYVARFLRPGQIQVSGLTISAARRPLEEGSLQAHFSSLFVEKVLQDGALTRHINNVLIPSYQKRYYAMVKTIRRVLYPLGVKIVADESVEKSGVAGGFFLYISFGADAADVASEISRVAFEDLNLKIGSGQIFGVPDDPLSKVRDRASYYSGARLCWAWHEEEEIVEGIERLGIVIRDIQEVMA